jgi:hypothetical protein
MKDAQVLHRLNVDRRLIEKPAFTRERSRSREDAEKVDEL